MKKSVTWPFCFFTVILVLSRLAFLPRVVFSAADKFVTIH